jgi:hypothetical protein
MKPDPLAGLRDIHLPEPVSWWPPALGWWLLLGLVLLVIAGLVWWLWHRKPQQEKTQQYAQSDIIEQALSELDALQADAAKGGQTMLSDISALLRRVAIRLHQDDASIAGLSGDDWLSWLDAQWDKHVFSEGAGRALLDAPYQRHSQVDIDQLLPLLRQWIEAQR